MKKKIILLLALVVISVSGHFVYRALAPNQETFVLDLYAPSGVDLYFSELESSLLPQLDLEDKFSIDMSEVNFPEVENIAEIPIPSISLNNLDFDASLPELNFSTPSLSQPSGQGSGQAPPAGQWTPNPSDCSQFSMAPNCSYVPEQFREMCEQCKAAGY